MNCSECPACIPPPTPHPPLTTVCRSCSPQLTLRLLAAATDCSSYFKLGVKGTTFQKCEHTSLCYAPSWVCDGANDCGDYSDERNCPGESVGRPFGHPHIGAGGGSTVLFSRPFSSYPRWEEAQMPGQLLCLSQRALHPHDVDLRQRGRLRERGG